MGDAFAYKLLDDAGGRFAISGGALVVADGSKLDFEQATSHSVTIRATDQTGRFVDQKITIAVTDVAAETIAGSDKDDVSVGGANNDTIGGGLGNDQLAGGLGSDKLSGGLGNDKLSGGLGKDVSAGGGGRDIFVFDTRLNKKTNLDKIVDFNHRDDTIHLAKSVFSKISQEGRAGEGRVLDRRQAEPQHDAVGPDRLQIRRLELCSTTRMAMALKRRSSLRPCPKN